MSTEDKKKSKIKDEREKNFREAVNADPASEPDDEPMTDSDREARGGIGDTVRKMVTLGLSAAFLTEESIRHMVSEFKLPKEVLGSVLHTAAKSKT